MRRATINFAMPVRLSVFRPSVCPHGTIRPPLHGFSWNLLFFENLSRKFKFHWNQTQITGTLREDLCTFCYHTLPNSPYNEKCFRQTKRMSHSAAYNRLQPIISMEKTFSEPRQWEGLPTDITWTGKILKWMQESFIESPSLINFFLNAISTCHFQIGHDGDIRVKRPWAYTAHAHWWQIGRSKVTTPHLPKYSYTTYMNRQLCERSTRTSIHNLWHKMLSDTIISAFAAVRRCNK